MIHELKIHPEYFEQVIKGKKKFEIRKNDRDYKVYDWLELNEYDPIKQEYTGRNTKMMVTYILHGGQFGIEEGYCVMSIV